MDITAITEFANGLLDKADTILIALLSIVGGASVLVKLTPTQKDDNFIAKIEKILKKISLNVEVVKTKKK